MTELDFKIWEKGEHGCWTFRSVFDHRKDTDALIDFLSRLRVLWSGIEFTDWTYSLTERFEYIIEPDRVELLDAPFWIFEVWTRKKEDAAAFVAAFSPTPVHRYEITAANL